MGKHNEYDVLIIGSGMGGLVCGNYLAREGINTLILEQHSIPGGYCTSFKRKEFLFDSAVHFFIGFEENGSFTGIVKDLGIMDRVKMNRLDPIYRVYFGDDVYIVPADLKEYMDMLQKHFPEEKTGLVHLFSTIKEIYNESQVKGMIKKEERIYLEERFPQTLKYLNMTFDEMVSEFIRNERLKSIIGAGWPYNGLPPSKISAIKMAGYLYLAHYGGFYYPEGGIQAFSDILVDRFKENGGEIRLRTQVTKILVEDNKAVGVETSKGERIYAKHIVSNADATNTFTNLITPELLPAKFLKRLKNMEPSTSFAQVWLGIDNLDLTEKGFNEHDIFYYPTYDLDSAFYEADGCGICIPTITDKRYNDKNKHVVSIIVPYEYSDNYGTGEYKKQKSKILEKLIEMAGRIIPGMSESIVAVECCMPYTFKRYTSNSRGAAYGWSPTPENLKRSISNIPISNLHLAGHWTFHTGSTLSAALSGRFSAKEIMME